MPSSTEEFRAPIIEIFVENDRQSYSIIAFAMCLGPKRDGMYDMPLNDKETVPYFLTLPDAVKFAMTKASDWVEWGMADAAVISYEWGGDYETAAFFVSRNLAGGSNDPAAILKRFPVFAEQGYAAP